MGLLDYLYLIIFGSILIITSALLIVSLKNTNDEVKKVAYRRTYMLFITGSIIMLILYVGFVSIGNVALDLISK